MLKRILRWIRNDDERDRVWDTEEQREKDREYEKKISSSFFQIRRAIHRQWLPGQTHVFLGRLQHDIIYQYAIRPRWDGARDIWDRDNMTFGTCGDRLKIIWTQDEDLVHVAKITKYAVKFKEDRCGI